ncbi:V-set and transmembrane domain-containing protein 2B [Mastacembelus armatus]|uniref:V-set and transmembrane domain-containing protein 2B n=1 Tax=Mastacembelus armatus TaxID=205130 RepID=A0A3Q3RFH4_9TELE|nr:V-set and transmembrane domain-containing protein 2B [Mastacembelus armatus]
MEKTGLYSLIYYFILNSPFLICVNATFTEVPKDVSVGEGEDVEMPCAFKAVSSAPMALEIQWWYLKEDVPKELPHELQISAPANRAKVVPREATKISTVRVQGNAISHRLSLSKVKKEDEGVYECRVSDLWAEETQEFTVHATLHVTPVDGMVAEEAVSHIQNRWPLRNANTALGGVAAGRATSEPNQGLAGGPRSGQGKHRVPQQAHSGLLPSISSTTTISVAKSSASPLPGNAAILRQQHGAGCSVMSTMDPLLCITLLFLHKLLPFLLAH